MPREITINQAATALGVTVDTVRHRLRSGKLSGRKDDGGRWLVTLADATPEPGEHTPDLREPTPEPGETYADRVRELEGQVIRLTVERDAAVAERDRLWQMLSGTLGRLLPRPGETLPAETQTPSEPRRWWQVWR